MSNHLKELVSLSDIKIVHNQYNNIFILRNFLASTLGLKKVAEDPNLTHYTK